LSNSDTERLFDLAGEISQRLSGAFQGMIPPDAQRHLLNAQRELLTAVFLIYEHQMGARRQWPRDFGSAARGFDEAGSPEPQEESGGEPEGEPPPPRPRVRRVEVE
jgi:hypothetical protein